MWKYPIVDRIVKATNMIELRELVKELLKDYSEYGLNEELCDELDSAVWVNRENSIQGVLQSYFCYITDYDCAYDEMREFVELCEKWVEPTDTTMKQVSREKFLEYYNIADRIYGIQKIYNIFYSLNVVETGMITSEKDAIFVVKDSELNFLLPVIPAEAEELVVILKILSLFLMKACEDLLCDYNYRRIIDTYMPEHEIGEEILEKKFYFEVANRVLAGMTKEETDTKNEVLDQTSMDNNENAFDDDSIYEEEEPDEGFLIKMLEELLDDREWFRHCVC